MKTTSKCKIEKVRILTAIKKITIGVVLVELFPGASAILTNEI
jgi:hypothetical protein